MLKDAAGIRRVVIACGFVDLRKGIDGLAQIIGSRYGQNPFEKGKAANTRKKQNLFRNGQIISMNPGQTANSLEDGSSSAENTDMECGMAAASGDIYG